MKLLGFVLALSMEPIVYPTFAQVTGGGGLPSAFPAGISTFAEEDIPYAGVTAVRAIAPDEEKVARDLIEKLEADGETTGETRYPSRPRRARSGVSSPLHLRRFQLASDVMNRQ